MKSNVITSILQTFALILIFMIIRTFEYAYVWNQGAIDFSFALFFERSINLDTLFVYYIGASTLVLCFIIGLLNEAISKQIRQVIGVLTVLIHLLLTGYFLLANNILNASLFEFSLKEVFQIMGNETSLHSLILMAVIVLFVILTTYVIYKKVPNYKLSKRAETFVIVAFLLAGFFAFQSRNHTTKSLKYFDSNFEFMLGNSKEVLFLSSIANDNKDREFHLYETIDQTQVYQQSKPNFRFTDDQYPLIHNEPYNNVLGSYFIKDSAIQPNIVIIISESLSNSFSGPYCSTPKSLTPFVDSLRKSGLNWNNFYSNAERSFGVLPNILSSLPPGIGRRGFSNMRISLPGGKMYPSHTSMLELLNSNNYQSSFYYGGWGYYDNMGFFLETHKLDRLVTEDSFNNQLFDRNSKNFAWGYNDKALFKQSVILNENRNRARPFIDIYQTLSLHSPYSSASRDYYSKEFNQRRLSSLGIENEKSVNIPEHILSSLFFSEDALKQFIQEVSKTEKYKNTIFILTGDHGIDYPVGDRPLDKFNVPLIIFSDLLIGSESFNGFSSHIDVTPSLLALLQQNFGLHFPENKHWMGEGLDTSDNKGLRNSRVIPLSVYDDLLPQFVIDNYIIYKDHIVEFNSKFKTKEVTNEKQIRKLRQRQDNYMYINEYACLRDQIWEDK